MSDVELPELWGLQEIAATFGVEPATAQIWSYRAKNPQGKTRRAEPLPDPDVVISGAPIWVADRIRAWGDRTGRAYGHVPPQT